MAAHAFATVHHDLVPFFIQMATDFDDRRALPENAHLVFEITNPAPAVTGFNNVPEHFRPIVFKFIQRAMSVNNFTLDMVFAPEFGVMHDQPQMIVMQQSINNINNRLNAIEQDIININTNQNLMQQTLTGIAAQLAQLLANANNPNLQN